MGAKSRITVLIVMLALAVQSAGQGTSDSRSLIAGAIEKTELRVAEVAPFRLTAEIQIRVTGAKTGSGVYELLWVSAERWREDISVAGIKETRIGGAGKVWQFPGRSPEAGEIRAQARGLAFRERLGFEAGDTISSPKERKVEGIRLLCLKAKSKGSFEVEYCFDPTSGLLARSKGGPRWLTFADYRPAGGKSFPYRLGEGDKEVLRVLAIETHIQPAHGFFDPPPGVVAEPGCQYPKFPSVVKMEDPEYPRDLHGGRGMSVVAGLVTVNGSIEDVSIIRSGGPGPDSSAIKAVRQWRFQPATCGSTPVPYKIAIEVAFSGP